MSEYKRQIAAGATVAVVVAFVLALGVGTLFPQAATTESLTTPVTSATMTSSLPSSTASTASSASSVPTSGTSSSTAVSSTGPTTSSTTTPLQTTYSTTSTSTSTGTVSMTTTESTTTTVTVSTTSATTITTTQVPTVCYTCGILKIDSANLTVEVGASRTILSLNMANNGSQNVSNLSVSLASTAIVVIPVLAAGAQTWVSIQVPNSQFIQVGQSYQITIQGGYAGYLVGANATMVASN